MFKAEIQMRAAVRIQAYARRARARRALRAERLCKAVTVMQSIYREKQAKRVIHATHLLDPHPLTHARPSSPVARPRCHALGSCCTVPRVLAKAHGLTRLALPCGADRHRTSLFCHRRAADPVSGPHAQAKGGAATAPGRGRRRARSRPQRACREGARAVCAAAAAAVPDRLGSAAVAGRFPARASHKAEDAPKSAGRRCGCLPAAHEKDAAIGGRASRQAPGARHGPGERHQVFAAVFAAAEGALGRSGGSEARQLGGKTTVARCAICERISPAVRVRKYEIRIDVVHCAMIEQESIETV